MDGWIHGYMDIRLARGVERWIEVDGDGEIDR